MDLHTIDYLIVVAEQHSIRGAARVLNVEQSAVSRRIRQLEDEIGVSLFERSARGVRLTPAGTTFLAGARRALTELANTATNAASAGRGEVGELSIGFLVVPPAGMLIDILATFQTSHPETKIRVMEASRTDLLSSINGGGLDIAFLIGRSAPEGLDAMEIGLERIMIALPATHRLAVRRHVAWQDLRDERLLVSHRDPGPDILREIVSYIDSSDRVAVESHHDVTCCHLPILAGANLGVALICEASSGATFSGVAYRPILQSGRQASLPLQAVWRPTNDNPPLRRFLSLIRLKTKT